MTTFSSPADHVFTIREGGQQTWKVLVGGKVIATNWPDKGSALAGMATEQRRARRKLILQENVA